MTTEDETILRFRYVNVSGFFYQIRSTDETSHGWYKGRCVALILHIHTLLQRHL